MGASEFNLIGSCYNCTRHFYSIAADLKLYIPIRYESDVLRFKTVLDAAIEFCYVGKQLLRSSSIIAAAATACDFKNFRLSDSRPLLLLLLKIRHVILRQTMILVTKITAMFAV